MGPHPLLLNGDICDADINRPGRLKHQVAVLEEVLEGEGGGGDTKDVVKNIGVEEKQKGKES